MEYQPLPSLGERANSNYYRRDRGNLSGTEGGKGIPLLPPYPGGFRGILDAGAFPWKGVDSGKTRRDSFPGGSRHTEFCRRRKIKCVYNKVELGE